MKKFFGVLSIIFIIVFTPEAVWASPTTDISLRTGSVKKGDNFTVEVYVNTNDNTINAADIVLTYDSGKITPQGASVGSFFPSTTERIKGTLSSTEYLYGIFASDKASARKGEGILANITFKAEAEGTTTISIVAGKTMVYGIEDSNNVVRSLSSVGVTINASGSSDKGKCDSSCGSDSDCENGLVCSNATGVKRCRNNTCPIQSTCSCPPATPTPTRRPYVAPRATATPTPRRTTPTPVPTIYLPPLDTPTPEPEAPQEVVLAITPFTNDKKEVQGTFVLSGTATPYASIDISISPDGVTGQTTADSTGKWRYILTKALKPGQKQLTVVARTEDGGESTSTEAFTVVGGTSSGVVIGIILLAVALGGAGYVFWRKKTEDAALFGGYGNYQTGSNEPAGTAQPGSLAGGQPQPQNQPASTSGGPASKPQVESQTPQ